ncbi:MAG: hypothetical protein ACREX9_03060 [Gammaproteobacteria bacterium]
MLFVLAWSGVAFNLGDQDGRDRSFSSRCEMRNYPSGRSRSMRRPFPGTRRIPRDRLMAEQSVRHGFAIEHEPQLSYDRTTTL